MISMTEEKELTLTEAAARLRISADTCRTLLQAEAIPARKQGRQWRIREADVNEYIRKSREKRG